MGSHCSAGAPSVPWKICLPCQGLQPGLIEHAPQQHAMNVHKQWHHHGCTPGFMLKVWPCCDHCNSLAWRHTTATQDVCNATSPALPPSYLPPWLHTCSGAEGEEAAGLHWDAAAQGLGRQGVRGSGFRSARFRVWCTGNLCTCGTSSDNDHRFMFVLLRNSAVQHACGIDAAHGRKGTERSQATPT